LHPRCSNVQLRASSSISALKACSVLTTIRQAFRRARQALRCTSRIDRAGTPGPIRLGAHLPNADRRAEVRIGQLARGRPHRAHHVVRANGIALRWR
jgi:hypothetical protein